MKPTHVPVHAGTRPIGYAKLILDRRLSVMPPARLSFVAPGARREISQGSQERIIYPVDRDPGTGEAPHLTFAIKNEGLNLEVLSAYFGARGPSVESELV